MDTEANLAQTRMQKVLSEALKQSTLKCSVNLRLLRLEASLTLKDVGRTHVNLGDNHKDRYIECQRQAQVLLGHPHDASIAAHLPQQKGTVSTRKKLLGGQWTAAHW